MDDDPDFTEPSVTARERALQEKIIRLEKKLEGYQTQIDIIDSQRQQLEERAIRMESALARAKKELLEARKELMDKEIAEKELVEKLNSMTQQAEECKNRFKAERNKNKYNIETLEALLSTVEAEISPRKEFQGFLNEILTEVKEGFYAQLKVVFDKLTEAESRFHRSPQEMNQCKTIVTTSCSATQFGICGKGEVSTATSSSPQQYGVFSTAATTTATSNSQIAFRKIGTAATTSATSNSPTQFGMFGKAATMTATSNSQTPFGKIGTTTITSTSGNSPAQYGLISTGAITTATSSPAQYGMSGAGAITKASTSWPTQYGMIGTTATTRATSSSSTQYRLFDTAETTTVTSSSPAQYGMIGRAVTTTFSAIPPIQSSQTQVPFKQCQRMTTKGNSREQETTAIGTSKKSSDQRAKFAPKPGAWTCPVCLVSNEERTTVCVACGAAKLSDGTTTALEVLKTGFHLLNQTTTSSASNTGSGILRGNTSSRSPFTFGKSDSGSVNRSPIKFGISATGPVNSSQFDFKISDKGGVNCSQFNFGISDSGPRNSSPLTFAKTDTGTTKSSITAFFKTDAGTVNTSPFTFGAPPSAPDDTCPSQKAIVSANQVAGGSSGMLTTSKPTKPQPFVLPTSPGRTKHDSSTSFTEDIHEQIKVQTGEEDEELMFSCKAKLYRYDGDVSAWKQRGIGTIKILYNSEKRRSRILMRREAVHKICANHFITDDMKLTDKKGTANTWIWNTFADFSEEVSKPEQLAVKFKSQDDFLLFKEKFEQCQKMTKKDGSKQQETTAHETSLKSSDLMAKFAPKPGSWSCTVCRVNNEERTTVCLVCGTAKLSDGTTSALKVPKTGFHLLNQTTTSSASNIVFGGYQGYASSGNPFTFGLSDTGSVNSSPFKFGLSDSGTQSSSPFTFGSSSSGPVKSSSFTFATSDTGTTKSSTFTFRKSDAGTVNSSPFTFGKNDAGTINTSPFRFGVPPLTRDHTSTTEKAAATASQVVGGSTELPPTSNPATTQPFVLPAFGVPAIASKTDTASFTFVSSSLTGSSPLSVSMSDKAVSEKTASTVEKSVFGGSTPEQGGAALSFGSFKTRTSPSFHFGLPPHSKFGTQPDPLVPEKFRDVNQVIPTVSQKAKVIQNQSQPLFLFGTPTDRHDVSEEKLVWRQPTGTFQFGQLDAYTPLGGATSWTAGLNPCHQATQHSSKSETFKIQGALQTSETFSQPLKLSKFSGSELLQRLAAAKEQQDYSDQESQSPMPPIQSSQTQPPFSPSQREPQTSALKPVPIHSTLGDNAGTANLPPKSALKATEKREGDCVIVHEVRASMANREKASRLFLPFNFLNYTKQEVCAGCRGCRSVTKESATLSKKEDEQSTVVSPPKENIRKPEKSASGNASHVFGESSIVGQLTFSSVKPKESDAFSLTQNREGAKPFQGAGTQLFAEISENVEGQDEDKLHFEPVIPLPDEIKVVTGEEGLEVLFSERAKLYRLDADSGQWKERGVGNVKLLRHPKSGQGRVLMRREQIKKLCANHNINSGMELKPNVGSDRSWVWYTAADYAEGEARPEKLAIKLKSAEIAEKFREVFEDLKETFSAGMPPEVEQTNDQQGGGCALYKEFISTFAASSDAWTCEMCYVENSTKDSKCIACNSVKPGSLEPLSKTEGEDVMVTLTSTNTSVDKSVELNTFQDFNKDSTSGGSIFQSHGLKGLASSQLFTIGQVESSEDKLDDEIYLSPSKTSSPSKKGGTPQAPSTPLFQENVVTSLPFGTNTPAKFTFSLQVSPESPSRKPKSPLSPASPLSTESPGHVEDDGPHFEPVIPLPEKVECRTGEEGHAVMFCERCKLFRYDSDASQWKERGVGDIKILFDPSSGRYRVLMRREHVFKLCANHMISVDMELKPFPNSDRAWLWTTLADFSDEVAAAETLGAKFKTSQVAAQFKDTFDKALQSLKSEAKNIPSSGKPNVKETDQESGKKRENDISLVFERRVTDDQKERAKRLELPSNFYGFEDSASGTDSGESKPVASEQSKPTADVAEEESAPSNFLFGSSSVASLSFQSVAVSSLGSSPFGQKSQQKSPGFIGAGAQLFAAQNTEDDAGTAEVDHDGPHFEPIIPLPDKIHVKTGEEDEEVMFSHRAKLYRFVADDKQWKERGVGDIKLLRNRQSGKMRVLMRRDQVLKICANHQITIDMKLQPNAGSDRSWVWSTLADFSEQECKAEQLAVRFKSEDIAKQFKEKFEECQELLKNQTPVKTLEKEQAEEEVKDDLATKFKAAEGSWECDICMVRNDSDKVECTACGGLKPGAEPRQDQQKDTKTFVFGSTAPSGSVFLFGSASQSTGAGFSFGSAGRSQGDDRFLSFGSFSEAQNSTAGIQVRFGSFGQEEHVTEQQTEDNKKTDSPTVKEMPRKEVVDTKDEQVQKEEAQKEDMKKSFSFSSSDSVSSFASSALYTDAEFSFNQTPSSGAGISFGSTDISQSDAKAVFSVSQTSTSSSEVTISVVSSVQKWNLSEHTVENQNVTFQLDDHKPREDDKGGDEVEGNAATDETQAKDASRQETVLSANPIKVNREEKPVSDGLPLSSGEDQFQHPQDISKQTAAETEKGGNDKSSETTDETHPEEKSSPNSEKQPVLDSPSNSGTEEAASNAENSSELD